MKSSVNFGKLIGVPSAQPSCVTWTERPVVPPDSRWSRDVLRRTDTIHCQFLCCFYFEFLPLLCYSQEGLNKCVFFFIYLECCSVCHNESRGNRLCSQFSHIQALYCRQKYQQQNQTCQQVGPQQRSTNENIQ